MHERIVRNIRVCSPVIVDPNRIALHEPPDIRLVPAPAEVLQRDRVGRFHQVTVQILYCTVTAFGSAHAFGSFGSPDSSVTRPAVPSQRARSTTAGGLPGPSGCSSKSPHGAAPAWSVHCSGPSGSNVAGSRSRAS
jgi:hypothetical protein